MWLSRYTFSASFEGPCGALSLLTQNPAFRAVSCVFFASLSASRRWRQMASRSHRDAIDAPSRRHRGVEFSADTATAQLKFLGLNMSPTYTATSLPRTRRIVAYACVKKVDVEDVYVGEISFHTGADVLVVVEHAPVVDAGVGLVQQAEARRD